MATIMVVEDDDDLRELFAEALRDEQYGVVCASNGREALELLNQVEPCLLLLDIMMPVMSGTELLQKLEDDKRLDKLPVVVISAIADEVAAPGANRYIRKPVEIDELVGTVRELCATEPVTRYASSPPSSPVSSPS